MTDRERLIALMDVAREYADFECDKRDGCSCCPNDSRDEFCLTPDMVDYLLAHGVTVQRWIPVTERLLEKEDTYLVYTERGSVYASHFYTEKKFASGYVREASWSQRGKVKVTHWMPLPEPPKEGE